MVVTGLSYNGSISDHRTIKYDAATGDELWNVRMGYNTIAHGIATDLQGNVVVTGWSSNNSTMGNRTIKYDAATGD